MTQLLLKIERLTKYFPITKGLMRKTVAHIKAVDDVSFDVGKGETLGLVGESGCGKTTTGRLILRLLERTAGAMTYHIHDAARQPLATSHQPPATSHQPLTTSPIDLCALRGEGLRTFRKHMQLIFQDPFSSLNPRMTVLDIISEPLRAHNYGSRREIEDRVRDVSRACGLQPDFLRRYPHAFSGGQRQRICIARALVLNPQLVICDEPVSALDVSVQAQIINLLKDIQQQFGLTYLFIAHDLSVVENISARVAVMYTGRIVEMAETNELFHSPRHPYTEALMNALPVPVPKAKSERILLKGEVADPSNLPPGCAFHPRCRYCEDPCKINVPQLREISPNHFVSCHRAEEIKPRGVVS